MWDWLTVAFFAMLPVVELRGAVPIGLGLGLPHIPVLIVSILANMIPVPFIILGIRHVFRWMRRHSSKLERLVSKLEARAAKKANLVRRYELLGLYILFTVILLVWVIQKSKALEERYADKMDLKVEEGDDALGVTGIHKFPHQSNFILLTVILYDHALVCNAGRFTNLSFFIGKP